MASCTASHMVDDNRPRACTSRKSLHAQLRLQPLATGICYDGQTLSSSFAQELLVSLLGDRRGGVGGHDQAEAEFPAPGHDGSVYLKTSNFGIFEWVITNQQNVKIIQDLISKHKYQY